MGLLVIFFLILLPVAEIATLIAVGSRIGFFATIGVLIAAGVLGTLLLRVQGSEMLLRLRQSMARREPPDAVIFDGLCLAAAGVLLVLPGLLSDVMAIMLLLPPVRAVLRAYVLRGRGTPVQPGVIDVEFVDVTPTRPTEPPPRIPGPESRQ
jgi:UPF0716 protein FxsA